MHRALGDLGIVVGPFAVTYALLWHWLARTAPTKQHVPCGSCAAAMQSRRSEVHKLVCCFQKPEGVPTFQSC